MSESITSLSRETRERDSDWQTVVPSPHTFKSHTIPSEESSLNLAQTS